MENSSDFYTLKAIELLKFMGQTGIRYPKDHMDTIVGYVEQMITDERIIEISDGYGLHSVIFFAICNDYKPFYKKQTWEFMKHDSAGDTIYIEKAVSKAWGKIIRNDVRDIVLLRYPKLQTARWHRWAKWGDRPVIIKRRIYV